MLSCYNRDQVTCNHRAPSLSYKTMNRFMQILCIVLVVLSYSVIFDVHCYAYMFIIILPLQHQNTEQRNVENTERRRTAIRSVVEMGYSQSVVQACVDRLVERGNYAQF